MKKISVTVDPGIHARAKALGLNVSRICENALRDAVERLRGAEGEANKGRARSI